MICPRCEEPNLPGVATCLVCRASLIGLPALERSVPRAVTANPLARPLPKLPKIPLPTGLVAAILPSMVPGLRCWRAGDRRGAKRRIAAVLLPTGLGLLLWYSELQFFCWSLAWLAWSWSLFEGIEAAFRSDGALGLGRRGRVGVALLSLGLLIGVQAAGRFALHQWRPEVSLESTRLLPGGRFHLRPLDRPPRHGELVAVRYSLSTRVLVAPVLGLPGDVVIADKYGVRVNGHRTWVRPMQRLTSWTGAQHVKPGEVLLFQFPLRPRPQEDLMGLVAWRWSPAALRGPVEWPPEDPLIRAVEAKP